MKVFTFSAIVERTERFDWADSYGTRIGIITDDSATAESLNNKYNGRDGIKKLGYTYCMNKGAYKYPLDGCKHLILDDNEKEIMWIK